jgi:hypothetical protein
LRSRVPVCCESVGRPSGFDIASLLFHVIQLAAFESRRS